MRVIELLVMRNFNREHGSLLVFNTMMMVEKDNLQVYLLYREFSSRFCAVDFRGMECKQLEPNVVKEIVDNLNQIDIWRIYLLTPTEHDRARFNKLLTGTIHENIYNQLLERVPNLDNLEHGQFKYFDILKEYVFDKQTVKGVITIDKGAYNAMRRGAKLFPVGILKVSGDFDYGDLVQIECSGRDAFISIVEANSKYLRDNKGKRTDVIMELTQTTQIPVVSRKKYRYRNGNTANSL